MSRYINSSSPCGIRGNSWGGTEIAIIKPGGFANAKVIAEQIALLCRNPPLWDGYLRLPGPMQLGKQVAADHPIVEMRRKADANRLDG